jgi:hypothetical protein
MRSVSVLTWLVCFLAALLAGLSVARADSLWEHNGSVMRLVADGNTRLFYYEQPRPTMVATGVRQGTLYFNGRRQGNSYIGTARVFSSKCDAAMEFAISGTVVSEHLVILEGDRPSFKNCRATGETRHERLVFTFLSEVPAPDYVAPKPVPLLPPPVIAEVEPDPPVPVVEVVAAPEPAVLTVVPAPPSVLPTVGSRVALVIGNGAYTHANPLPNPGNDARAMATLLTQLGFGVVLGVDLDKDALEEKVREFVRTSRNADLAMFFYAGHAIQVAGENYIVPVDALVEDETALTFELMGISAITGYMGGEDQVGVILLDACRDNPFVRSLARSMRATRAATVDKGLAPIAAVGGGLLVAYATAPGDVASDGIGNHSPFTAALLRNLATPGVELEQLMKRVKNEVATSTKQDQRPWTNSDLTTEVYLVPPG